MWTRKELKTKAKQVLKGTYWKAFLVSLVLLLSGGGNTGNINLNLLNNKNEQKTSYMQKAAIYGTESFNSSNSGISRGYNSGLPITPDLRTQESIFIGRYLFIIGLVAFLIFTAVFAYRIFVGYSLEVGSKKYYIEASRGNADMNLLTFGFNRTHYKNIVVAMFYRGIMNLLWYFVLIIPGIIKRYSYMMVPYILADNPDMERREAIALSSEMMDGEKFKTFILELSFIGWYILGLLALTIGVMFVNPYVYQTEAELYLFLKKKVSSELGFHNGGIIENI